MVFFKLRSNAIPCASNLLKLGAIRHFSQQFVIRFHLPHTKSRALSKSTAAMFLSFKNFSNFKTLMSADGALKVSTYHFAEASIHTVVHNHFRFDWSVWTRQVLTIYAKKCISFSFSRIGCFGPYDRSFYKIW